MSRYARRLERDLVRWRDAGWVSADGAAAIRRDVESQASGVELAPVLGILGAILIGFGAMSFVAAHWDEMARLFRLAIIFGGLFGAYGLAGYLFQRSQPAFAHAAVLVGVAIFGAGIMLIAQMYHIEGDPPDAVLTWALGALLAGILLQSNPALGLAMLLMGLWTAWQMSDDGVVHWPFLAGWAAVTAAIAWRGWGAGLHLAAVVLSAWIISLGYTLLDGHAHEIVVAIGLLILAAGVIAPRVIDGAQGWGSAAVGYGMVIAFAGLFALQFLEKASTSQLILLAVVTLALVLGVIGAGLRSGSPGMLWLGYGGFSLEALALYVKTVGTLLVSSLFFLSAGVIVVLLAAAAYRLLARTHPNAEVAP
jgi:uncharacterized membrane protein